MMLEHHLCFAPQFASFQIEGVSIATGICGESSRGERDLAAGAVDDVAAAVLKTLTGCGFGAAVDRDLAVALGAAGGLAACRGEAGERDAADVEELTGGVFVGAGFERLKPFGTCGRLGACVGGGGAGQLLVADVNDFALRGLVGAGVDGVKAFGAGGLFGAFGALRG